MNEARRLLRQLDEGREWHDKRHNRSTVQRIDFAIGATLSLRTAVEDYDKSVGRG